MDLNFNNKFISMNNTLIMYQFNVQLISVTQTGLQFTVTFLASSQKKRETEREKEVSPQLINMK
jgi:hypothetical protein